MESWLDENDPDEFDLENVWIPTVNNPEDISGNVPCPPPDDYRYISDGGVELAATDFSVQLQTAPELGLSPLPREPMVQFDARRHSGRVYQALIRMMRDFRGEKDLTENELQVIFQCLICILFQ